MLQLRTLVALAAQSRLGGAHPAPAPLSTPPKLLEPSAPPKPPPPVVPPAPPETPPGPSAPSTPPAPSAPSTPPGPSAPPLAAANHLFPYAEGAHQRLDDIPTQLAIGSDGRLYITAEELPESIRMGRRVFAGVALTPEETAFAARTIEDASSEVGQTIWSVLVGGNSVP